MSSEQRRVDPVGNADIGMSIRRIGRLALYSHFRLGQGYKYHIHQSIHGCSHHPHRAHQARDGRTDGRKRAHDPPWHSRSRRHFFECGLKCTKLWRGRHTPCPPFTYYCTACTTRDRRRPPKRTTKTRRRRRNGSPPDTTRS